MVAKADHTIGPGELREKFTLPHWKVLEEKKMFNIAYLPGILVILVPWNSIFIGFLATGFSFPIQQICMGGLSHSSRFTNAPLVIGMTFLALGIIYVVIIRSAGNRHVKRGETHKYLLVNVRFLYIMSNSPFYPFMKTTFPAYHILSYIIIYLSLIDICY